MLRESWSCRIIKTHLPHVDSLRADWNSSVPLVFFKSDLGKVLYFTIILVSTYRHFVPAKRWFLKYEGSDGEINDLYATCLGARFYDYLAPSDVKMR
jgi:hypothetical protein